MRDDFATLLGVFRRWRALSCNELARAIGCDPSYISRMERGEREPPRRPVVEALVGALALGPDDGDRLLVAAGYVPAALARLGDWDPVLQAVAGVLDDPNLAPAERAAFRQVVLTLAARWRTFPRPQMVEVPHAS